MTEERDSCLTCKRLLECSMTSEMCEKYQYEELDEKALSTRYIKAVKKLNDAISELKQAEVGLKIIEEMGDKAKKSDEKTTQGV